MRKSITLQSFKEKDLLNGGQPQSCQESSLVSNYEVVWEESSFPQRTQDSS